MQINKAVITYAGKGQHALPFQTLVDRDGIQKSALSIILNEVLETGIKQIALVITPGTKNDFLGSAPQFAQYLTFIEQDHPRGYGDAILRTRDFVGNEGFLHLVGDHLFLSHTTKSCMQQLVDTARAEDCAVSGVHSTRETMLTLYGTIGGKIVDNQRLLYQVETVVEKPTPTEAEQHLIVPGQRAGYYLCFFGMHVLSPGVISLLSEISTKSAEPFNLSCALSLLGRSEKYLALEIQGQRFNIGVKYGILSAQLAFGLSGQDREAIIAQIADVLSERERLLPRKS